MQVQPYLMFDGRCEEAINFYKTALGAEVCMIMRFGESPEPPPPGTLPPGSENKVMHAALKIGESTVNLSDGHCSGKGHFGGFSLTIVVKNEQQAERAFNALADGGKVGMPLHKTFFSPKFGMVGDRFGVSWMVYVQPSEHQER